MDDRLQSRQRVRVLIVDDSAFARRTLTKILEQDSRVEVVGTAWDGREAIDKISRLHPDVVTMDLNMPNMTGTEALDIIMREMPLPVIVVSSLDQEIIEETLEALEHGAVDFILKPTELASEKLFQIQSTLINKVVAIASLKGEALQHTMQASQQQPIHAPALPAPPPISSTNTDCVAIGVSTGGPTALYQIIPALPTDFPAGTIIVQHMPAGFTKPLAERMNKNSHITVKEAEMGDTITPGVALVAPGGKHLYLERQKNHAVMVRIDSEPSHTIHIPSIDITFTDVANIYRERCIGVILTGMGKDGVEGLATIKHHGGRSIAEDESTCVVFGMPEVAIKRGIVDRVVPVYHLAETLLKMIQ
ncbi:chemotaxis-specific protein-glutamate methyltransferase CheB [candidate division KSB3 bacterium]|uniref:Protein-glutamate methylesterase/protein-glutamine glutaminase n=1 Tax=candidate division KSB3 bacterium TaxID=2044937 RepID=A0A9D5K0V1_9BACT|nr:chemotaxis-specific protein-glutamate methyltransferase CheB [candidate division KSB3 bacterium]MBD3327356.1 chemotaxis-specific protein-glutamate methyltransferase CheB [candidate division KSB3 bacterium]